MLIVPVRPFPYNVSIKYTLECQTEEGNGGWGVISENSSKRNKQGVRKFLKV